METEFSIINWDSSADKQKCLSIGGIWYDGVSGTLPNVCDKRGGLSKQACETIGGSYIKGTQDAAGNIVGNYCQEGSDASANAGNGNSNGGLAGWLSGLFNGGSSSSSLVSRESACTLQGEHCTWNSILNGGKGDCECSSIKDPVTGTWSCAQGSVFVADPSIQPRGGYCKGDDSKYEELVQCVSKGYTWDHEKKICVDADGQRVDVYCEDGKGSIPKAIEDAMTIHGNFSVIQPHIDEIFQKGAGCFEGAINIYDTSPSIPTLADILGKLTSALKNFIVQKICDVANKLREKIIEPLSKAVSFINNLDKQGEIIIANLTSSIFSESSLSKVTSRLGWAGAPAAASGVLSVNGNALGLASAVYNANTCPPNQDAFKSMTDSTKLNEITQRMAELSDAIKAQQPKVENLETIYYTCMNRALESVGQHGGSVDGYCKQEEKNFKEAESQLAALKQEHSSLGQQLNGSTCVNKSEWSYSGSGFAPSASSISPGGSGSSGGSGNGIVVPPNTNAVGEECSAFDRITGRCSTGNVGTGHNYTDSQGFTIDAWQAYLAGTGPCPIADCSTLNNSTTGTVVNDQGIAVGGAAVINNGGSNIRPAGTDGIVVIGGSNDINRGANNGGTNIRPAGTAGSNSIVVIGEGEVNETTFDALIQQGMQNKQAQKQAPEKKGLADYLGTLGGLLK